jgi:hypothetical protein
MPKHQPIMDSQVFIKLTIIFTFVVQALVSIPSVEAKCIKVGTAGGRSVLRCTGGPSCCRWTGRTKVVNGVRYKVMDCSRCR